MKLLILCVMLGLTAGLKYSDKQKFNTESVTILEDDDYYYMASTGMPNHEYDDSVNPHDATAQNYNWTIPKNPTLLDTPSCIQGVIGFSLDGVPFFGPYTSGSLDAVETETFDDCQGHSASAGAYHYHQMSSCIFNTNRCPSNKLVGVALDGIPMYGPCDAYGNKLTHSDLDDCNGHTATFYRPNGNTYTQYVYRITEDFPYTINCYTYDVPNKNYASGTGKCSDLKSLKLNAHVRSENTNFRKSLIQALKELLDEN